jgi:hypothetical protein
MATADSSWAPQPIYVTILPSDDLRIIIEISTLEKGAERRIHLTEQEWERFKRAGDQHMRTAQRGGGRAQ